MQMLEGCHFLALRQKAVTSSLLRYLKSAVYGFCAGLAISVPGIIFWGILRGHIPLHWSDFQRQGWDFRWLRNNWKAEDLALFKSWLQNEGLPLLTPPSHRNFLCPAKSQRVSKQYFWLPTRSRLQGLVRFGDDTGKPTGPVQSGSIAAVIDDALGHAVQKATQQFCVTKKLKLQRGDATLKPGTTVHVEAWVDGYSGREISAKASIASVDGRVEHASADAVFVNILSRAS